MAISDAHLLQGFTQTELAKMFTMSGGEVRSRLQDVPSSGMRNGRATYRMRDAAPKLMRMVEDAELVERILRMKHTQLPPALAKEFWQGQLNKQRFETLAGDLWPTVQVMEYVGGAYKTIRLSLQLLMDAVERETTLTDVQRRIIQDLVDATLEDMRETLQKAVKKNVRAKNRRESASHAAASPQEDERYADL
jgi:hypothetical protein